MAEGMNEENLMNENDRRLRAQLQQAVRSQEVPPYLEARIRANLSAAQPARSIWNRQWAAAAVVVTVLVGGAVVFELGHLRMTSASQESYIVSVSKQVASIMRVGLSNHLHCAYFGKTAGPAPSMTEFIQAMGPKYSGLIPVVRQAIPERFRLADAHQCISDQRRFVHMVFKDDAKLISLVVARKKPGEAFNAEGLLPALSQSGLQMYNAGVQQFQIASFESRYHLVYLISDLSKDQNMGHLLAMAPAVKGLLAAIEL